MPPRPLIGKYVSQPEVMLLSEVLRQYLLLFSEPRYRSRDVIPDGSPLLDCLSYGLRKLVEEIQRGEDVLLDEAQLRKLNDLEARVSNVAFSSKHWSSEQEWTIVHDTAWELIEALGWDQDTPPAG